MSIDKKILKQVYLVLFALILLVGCGGEDEVTPPTDDQAAIDKGLIETFLEENSITATEDESGIFYYSIVENPTGATQQVSGSILSIYYSVQVLNGGVVDEVLLSQGEDPFKLKQGVNSIVPVGLDIGLALMKEEETFRFIIPSALAYGELTFSTLIPANSVIIIDVELVEIDDEAGQLADETILINNYIVDNQLDDIVANPIDPVVQLASGVYHKRITAGEPGQVPVQGNVISTTYTATFLDDQIFDLTSGNETFDYAFDNNIVIDGLDLGIGAMEVGERALLIIPSQLAYGPSVGVVPPILSDELVELQVIPQYASVVGPYEVLVFDIELL